jgi:hypothetical protein
VSSPPLSCEIADRENRFLEQFRKYRLTGELRVFLEHIEILDGTAPQWHYWFLVTMAAARLHLGDAEHAELSARTFCTFSSELSSFG